MRTIGIVLLFIIIGIGSIVLLKHEDTIQKTIVPFVPSVTTQPSHSQLLPQTPARINFTLPSRIQIHEFAKDLGSPRVLAFSQGGTLLVSDPSNNQVTALSDPDHQGIATSKKVVLQGGNHIHGLAFYNGKIYVAEVDKIVRYNWDEKNLEMTIDKSLFSLPQNNDHTNRTITFDQNGTMYVSVGSTCNVCIESNPFSATVIVSNANGDTPHIFVSGVRNEAFTAVNPVTNELWGTDMGRDNLGDTLPPDTITILKNGENYGWPYCYGNRIHDTNFDPSNKGSCTKTALPLYEISAHSAPLGLVFIKSSQFPFDWQNDLLVAYHGSWNRSSPIGYKVVHMKVNGNHITSVEDFITGFLQSGNALGRPVDLVFDTQGNLYISDDKAGTIYIVQKK